MKYSLLLSLLLYGLVMSGCANNSETSKTIEEDFVRITEKLSSSTVNDIIEDKFGYMWIATDRGLNKFNGYDYHNYFHTSNPGSIIDNQVKTLLCDSRGVIWVGTVLGLCHYTKQDKFQKVEINHPESPYVTAIHESAAGRIVVRTTSHFEVFDWVDNEATFAYSQPLEHSMCVSFSDDSGRVWLVYPDKLEWHNFDNNTHSNPIELEKMVYHTYMQEGGVLWLCCWGGEFQLFDTTTGEFLPTPKAIENIGVGVKSLMEYTDGAILIHTDDLRYHIYNPTTQECIALEEFSPTAKSPEGVISTSFVDSQGNLWFGSLDRGLSVHYAEAKQFNFNTPLTQTFLNKSIVGMDEDSRGNIYISTFTDGLWRWNIPTNSIIRMEVQGSNMNLRAERIYVDSEDNIWLNYPFFVIKYRAEEGTNRLTKLNYYFIPSGMVYDLTRDHQGRVWAGTTSGSLYLLGEGENQTTEFPIESGGQRAFMLSPEVITLADGRIMTISLGMGITLIDPVTLEQTNIPTWDVLHDVFIPTALRQHSSGEVWIGTRGQGLLVFDPQEMSVRLKSGIHCKEIMEIVEQGNGDLWISTMEGLTHWDKTSDSFDNFFASNGTGGDQYNESVGLLTSNGTLLFGGTHGITHFCPESVTNLRTAKLYIEDLYINNSLQHAYNSHALDVHLTEAERVEFRRGKDVSVGFTYVAIEYGEYPMLLYDYRLEGFEDEWINARGGRTATYSNLPAGKYRFCVRAWNNDRSQLVDERSVEVVVHSHFMLSPFMIYGFYPLLLVGVLVAGYLLYRRNRRREEITAQAIREKEQERRVNDMNMKFFVNISHEMRTPLTMIKGPLELLNLDEAMSDENRKLLGMTTRNVNRLLRFINQLMDISKIDNNSMSLEVGYSDVVEVINQMSEVFVVNATEKGVTFSKKGLGESYITLLNSDKLEHIVSNLLSNAIRFTPTGGRIELDFEVLSHAETATLFPQVAAMPQGEWVKLSVSDTGMGIPNDKLEQIFERYYQVCTEGDVVKNYGTGIGLYYSRCLVELHHGYIKAENRTDTQGARFTFVIPTSMDAYIGDRQLQSPQTKLSDEKISLVVEPSPKSMTTDQHHRQTLLFVEDDVEMMGFVNALFSKEYNILNAYDADSAQALLAEQLPDIVVSDVVMPGKMDGYALCRMIKEDLNTCHIPVVLLTAKTTIDAQVEGLDAGADAYVMKPFEPSYLLALVGSLLTNRDRLRGLLGKVTHTQTIKNEKLSPYDKEFLDSLYELMEKELSNTELNITRMTEVLKIGRTRFYYKVKGLTGENPNVFFKTYKLNRAAELLAEGEYNISEVADMTGFSTLSHFSTSFKRQFGCSPSDYISSVRNTQPEETD